MAKSPESTYTPAQRAAHGNVTPFPTSLDIRPLVDIPADPYQRILDAAELERHNQIMFGNGDQAPDVPDVPSVSMPNAPSVPSADAPAQIPPIGSMIKGYAVKGVENGIGANIDRLDRAAKRAWHGVPKVGNRIYAKGAAAIKEKSDPFRKPKQNHSVSPERRAENEAHWASIEGISRVQLADPRFAERGKEGINVSTHPHSDSAIDNTPTQENTNNHEEDLQVKPWLIEIPESIKQYQPEIAEIWGKLDSHSRVRLFELITELDVIAAAHPNNYHEHPDYREKLHDYTFYSDILKGAVTQLPEDADHLPYDNAIIEEEIRKPDSWQQLDFETRSKISRLDGELEAIKLQHPDDYEQKFEYSIAYSSLQAQLLIAQNYLKVTKGLNINRSKLSEKQKAFLEMQELTLALRGEFFKNPAQERSPLYAALYHQHQRLLSNNRHLFAANPEPADNRRSFYEDDWLPSANDQIFGTNPVAETETPEPADDDRAVWYDNTIPRASDDTFAANLGPQHEDRTKEKRKLSPAAKKALIGGAAVAAAGAALYAGYRYMPDETKAKIKGVAIKGAIKSKDVASSGREAVSDAAKKAKEVISEKETVTQAVESIKSRVPSKEAALNGTKKAMKTALRRAKSGSKTSAKAVNAVKNRK